MIVKSLSIITKANKITKTVMSVQYDYIKKTQIGTTDLKLIKINHYIINFVLDVQKRK